jgi:hypothetical protein
MRQTMLGANGIILGKELEKRKQEERVRSGNINNS